MLLFMKENTTKAIVEGKSTDDAKIGAKKLCS
jgi:hypothetical protein